MKGYAEAVAGRLGRSPRLSVTTRLADALPGADAVVMAIELDRYFYWAQDFHIPRTFGFPQIYGENGGPGGLFHALRNMGPCVDVARTMERHCPGRVAPQLHQPAHQAVRGPVPAHRRARGGALPRGLSRHRADGAYPRRPNRTARRPRQRHQPFHLVRVGAGPRDRRGPVSPLEEARARGPSAARLGRDRPQPHPLPHLRPVPQPGSQPHRRVSGMGAGIPRQQRRAVLLRPRRGRALGDRRGADLDLQPRRPSHRHARVSGRTGAPHEADPGAEGSGGRGAGGARGSRIRQRRGSLGARA